MAEQIVELSDDSFQTECLESDVPVMVDFWAPWCGPCRALAPTVQKIAEELEGKVKVCKLNTDANPTIPLEYGVTAIPALLFFKASEEVHRCGGNKTASELKKVLQERCGVQV